MHIQTLRELILVTEKLGYDESPHGSMNTEVETSPPIYSHNTFWMTSDLTRIGRADRITYSYIIIIKYGACEPYKFLRQRQTSSIILCTSTLSVASGTLSRVFSRMLPAARVKILR